MTAIGAAIEIEAINLAKAVMKLESNGFIQSNGDEIDDLDCEHLRRIAIHHARRIQSLTQSKKREEKAEQ